MGLKSSTLMAPWHLGKEKTCDLFYSPHTTCSLLEIFHFGEHFCSIQLLELLIEKHWNAVQAWCSFGIESLDCHLCEQPHQRSLLFMVHCSHPPTTPFPFPDEGTEMVCKGATNRLHPRVPLVPNFLLFFLFFFFFLK